MKHYEPQHTVWEQVAKRYGHILEVLPIVVVPGRDGEADDA
jgi:hypothetical protein